MEARIERLIMASRWLQVPMYLGLAATLVVLIVKFFEEFVLLSAVVWGEPEAGVILAVLTLVDIVLVANLVVMVMIGGYENFVSKLDIAEASERLPWLGKLETGSIKVRVSTSIVLISAIHLLGAFINFRSVPNDKLLVLVAIHLAFVASAVMVGLVDRLNQRPFDEGAAASRPAMPAGAGSP